MSDLRRDVVKQLEREGFAASDDPNVLVHGATGVRVTIANRMHGRGAKNIVTEAIRLARNAATHNVAATAWLMERYMIEPGSSEVREFRLRDDLVKYLSNHGVGSNDIGKLVESITAYMRTNGYVQVLKAQRGSGTAPSTYRLTAPVVSVVNGDANGAAVAAPPAPPEPDAPADALLVEEARASVALDGETQSADPPKLEVGSHDDEGTIRYEVGPAVNPAELAHRIVLNAVQETHFDVDEEQAARAGTVESEEMLDRLGAAVAAGVDEAEREARREAIAEEQREAQRARDEAEAAARARTAPATVTLPHDVVELLRDQLGGAEDRARLDLVRTAVTDIAFYLQTLTGDLARAAVAVEQAQSTETTVARALDDLRALLSE